MLDAGEDCDPVGAANSCQNASNTGAGFICNPVTCQCACPTFVEFLGNPHSACNVGANAQHVCTSNSECPGGSCVAQLQGVLDTGWTGNGHDSTVVNQGKITVGVSSCTGSSRPCGVCTIVGPVDNLNPAQYPTAPAATPTPGTQRDINNHRCSNNTSQVCVDATPCFRQCVGGTNDHGACTATSACPGSGTCTAAAGTCEYIFGTYLPLAAGGVSTCVGNQVNGSIVGTANVESGSSASTANLTSRVFNGITLSNPCPNCVGDGTVNDGVRGGTCSGGARLGKACDINGASPNASFGATSLDCPPLAGAVIATLPINLSNTTGTLTRTLSAANPLCTATGWTTNRCQCDTCDDAASTPCSTNADCSGGTGICGGLRCLSGPNAGAPCPAAGSSSVCPAAGGGSNAACGRKGTATAANQCDAGATDCAADSGTPSPNDRKCTTGPNENFCGPTETFRGCAADSDCLFAGDTCSVTRFRDCFDNGVVGNTVTATGVVSAPVNDQADPTLAAMFCIGPTTSASVNNAAGLPGLGRLELPGHAKGFP